MMNTNINPFSEYGYQPQSGWTGRIMQLNEQGVDTESTVNFGKGFEPENPFLNPKDAFTQEVVDIAATVTDDELKSLFGEMPFGMTRRQALQEQIAAAYSGEGDEKHVDFSKLQAIGNGRKVTTPIELAENGEVDFGVTPTIEMFGSNATMTSTVFLVSFNVSENRIQITSTGLNIEDIESSALDVSWIFGNDLAYCYLTIDENGAHVSDDSLAGVVLKTRSTDN